MVKKSYLFIFLCLLSTHLCAQKVIPLAAGAKLSLSSDWQSYKSEKFMNKVTSYPLIEHKSYEGLIGVLDTKVKFYNPKDHKNLSSWLSSECNKLKKLYKDGAKVSFNDSLSECVVENEPTDKTRSMIQYLKARLMTKKNSSPQKAFIYTYNFYLPKEIQSDSLKESMKKAVHKLMSEGAK